MIDHLEGLIAVGGAIVAIVGAFFTAKAVISNLVEEVRELKLWKTEHEKQSSRKQGEYEGKISSLEKQLAVGDYKFVQVAKEIDEIKGDMKTLLERRREEWERELEARRKRGEL